MRIAFLVLSWLAFCANLFAVDATLEIEKMVGTKLFSIAVESQSYSQTKIDRQIGKMIVADLKMAGFYNVIEKLPEGASASLSYEDPIYQKAGLDQLVRYEVFHEGRDLGIRAKAYDIKARKQIWSQSYKVSQDDRYVFLAHYFVRDLANKLGKNLDWMGRSVILARQRGAKETQIIIADYTLKYQFIAVKNGFNVFPKWANKEQSAYYYTEYLKKPTLFLVDRYTGKKTKIIEGEGMLVCSDVSRDGNRLLLTMAPNDQPDIYELNLATKKLRQLTTYPGIDVNGRYIGDDESAFVFVTDRKKYPEIYYAKIDNPSSAIQFIFKGRNNNYVTTWKQYAVIVSRDTDSEFADNTFNLYLVSTKSDFIRRLTTTGKNNFPRFSESGDTIIYTKEIKRGRESALGIMRLAYNLNYLVPLEGSIQSIDW